MHFEQQKQPTKLHDVEWQFHDYVCDFMSFTYVVVCVQCVQWVCMIYIMSSCVFEYHKKNKYKHKYEYRFKFETLFEKRVVWGLFVILFAFVYFMLIL